MIDIGNKTVYMGGAMPEEKGTSGSGLELLDTLQSFNLNFLPGGVTPEEWATVYGPSPLLLPKAKANSLQYVKAFGGTEQRDVPDNYLQRQFIYMMDESYLLTDIVPTYDGRVEMDFQTTTLPSSSVYFLGGRTETFGGLFFVKTSAGVFMVDAFGNTSDDRYTSSVSVQNNTRYKFIYNNQVASLTSGGTTLFTNTFADENANGAALCINGLNNNGTSTASGVGIYLYSLKAWNGQGELVANYVPAVQKGTVPVVGFYDTVSKTFKTATAGTFAAGGEAVPTPDYPIDIVSNNGVLKVNSQGQIYTDGTVETIEDTIGNTATAEMLLKVDDYQDAQSIIDGVVTRNVGVKVLDGTEDWTNASSYTNIFYAPISGAYYNDTSAERIALPCTHFVGTDATNTNMADNSIKLTAQGSALTNPLIYIKASVSENNLTTWQNWLATQYQNGAPVIIVYPLKTATTETVTGQTLQVQAGDNTLEITQASLNNLELEAKYKKSK